jgi:transcriptional regulator with XRE-family HTH domain
MLGDNIKQYRLDRKLSLNRLAKLSGISPSYLSELENNISANPSREKLERIAEILTVNLEDFYKEEPKKLDEIDQLEAEYKIMFDKMKRISKSDRDILMKMIERFEQENHD